MSRASSILYRYDLSGDVPHQLRIDVPSLMWHALQLCLVLQTLDSKPLTAL